MKLLFFSRQIYPFLETEKKDRCKEEPLQEDGLNVPHPKNSLWAGGNGTLQGSMRCEFTAPQAEEGTELGSPTS